MLKNNCLKSARTRHACDTIIKSVLRSSVYNAFHIPNTPALSFLSAMIAPRLFWTCSKVGHAVNPKGDCTVLD